MVATALACAPLSVGVVPSEFSRALSAGCPAVGLAVVMAGRRPMWLMLPEDAVDRRRRACRTARVLEATRPSIRQPDRREHDSQRAMRLAYSSEAVFHQGSFLGNALPSVRHATESSNLRNTICGAERIWHTVRRIAGSGLTAPVSVGDELELVIPVR